MTDQSDQTEPKRRRPGEVIFAVILVTLSATMLWEAIGIRGAFDKLSSPAAIPMATTVAMLITSVLVALRTRKRPSTTGETFANDILPLRVIVMVVLLILFGLVFKTLGFLPTAAIFLTASIKYLGQRSWLFTLTVSLGSLICIWIIFRVVFTVLLPSGFVPEAEIIQFFRNLLNGAA